MYVEVSQGVWVNLNEVLAVRVEGKTVNFISPRGEVIGIKKFEEKEEAEKWVSSVLRPKNAKTK